MPSARAKTYRNWVKSACFGPQWVEVYSQNPDLLRQLVKYISKLLLEGVREAFMPL